jgi:SAM-dependent methyltransferase
VVGLDRDAASVAWASRRVAEAGFANIRFQAVEFNDFADPQSFDALIGRFILLYLPDPAATLRHLASIVRRGGIIVFHEPDFTEPGKCFPDIPLVNQCNYWLYETLRRTGARLDMGMRLYQTYRTAGFVGTATMVSHLSGCGIRREMVEFLVETIRNTLPMIEKYGLATREEVQIETLADRLETAAREADPQWIAARYISAWARKP